MIRKQPCKFCKVMLHLDIPDDYASMGDPLKIIQLACCNRCGDYYEGRRRIRTSIQQICYQFVITKVGDGERQKQLRETLVKATRSYAKLLCEHLRSDTLIWSEELADEMIKDPKNWPKVLSGYVRVTSKFLRQPAAQVAEPSLPYADP